MIPYPHFWSEEPEARRRAWRPTDEVRRRHPDMARAFLVVPWKDFRRMIETVLDCGISAVSHFNWLLKASFGQTPSG